MSNKRKRGDDYDNDEDITFKTKRQRTENYSVNVKELTSIFNKPPESTSPTTKQEITPSRTTVKSRIDRINQSRQPISPQSRRNENVPTRAVVPKIIDELLKIKKQIRLQSTNNFNNDGIVKELDDTKKKETEKDESDIERKDKTTEGAGENSRNSKKRKLAEDDSITIRETKRHKSETGDDKKFSWNSWLDKNETIHSFDKVMIIGLKCDLIDYVWGTHPSELQIDPIECDGILGDFSKPLDQRNSIYTLFGETFRPTGSHSDDCISGFTSEKSGFVVLKGKYGIHEFALIGCKKGSVLETIKSALGNLKIQIEESFNST